MRNRPPPGATVIAPRSRSALARALRVSAPIGALVVGASACSTVDVEPLPVERTFESGSRLGARVLDGGDAAVVFIGWVDTELGIDCADRLAADGALRCLPTSSPAVVYLDATCTERALSFFPCADIPAFVVGTSTAPACEEPASTVYEVGAAVSPTAVYYLDESTGACTPGDPGGNAFRRVGATVAPEKFAKMEIVDEPTGDALATRILRSEDGARRGFTVIERAKAAPCVDYLWDYDGAYGDVCVAGSPALLTQSFHLYEDAACKVDTDIVGLFPPTDTCGVVPDLILDFAFTGDDACGITYDVRRVGAAVTPPGALYQGTPSSCGDAPPFEPGITFHDISEVAPPSSFPALDVVRLGSGALRYPAWADADHRPLAPLGGFEHVDGRRCAAYDLDGELRCVDSMPVDDAAFSDAACSSPVFVTYGDGTCGAPAPTRAAFADTANCGAFPKLTSVVELGGVDPATTIYRPLPDGSCVGSPVYPGMLVHAVAATVDPASFPRVEMRVE